MHSEVPKWFHGVSYESWPESGQVVLAQQQAWVPYSTTDMVLSVRIAPSTLYLWAVSCAVCEVENGLCRER